MKTGILTYEAYENRAKNSIGSSRLRGSWLVRNWPEAELFKIAKKYDAIIFQKAYFIRFMRKYDGIKILDLCDPDWLQQQPVKECIEECDAVTTSSPGLAEFIRKMTKKPVHYIPDRVDLELHQDRKVHNGRAQKAVWFGYSNNHSIVDQALMSIKRLGLKLTVISDMPYYPSSSIEGIDEEWLRANVKNLGFEPEMINYDLIENADIVLNPKAETGKWKFKSENKTIIAWALGLPVARDSEDLDRWMDEAPRRAESEARLADVAKFWDIKKSVKQFQDVIDSIKK